MRAPSAVLATHRVRREHPGAEPARRRSGSRQARRGDREGRSAAAERTRTRRRSARAGFLAQKSQAYQAREQQAIALALAAPAGHAPSAAEIAQQIDRTAASQSRSVAAQASRDFDSYRKTLVAQDNGELQAAQKTLADRADRQFRAKQDELQAKESALSLDAGQPRCAGAALAAHAAFEPCARRCAARSVRSQLAALDRSEADALAALKNRDSQTLATLAAQLRAQVQREMQAKAAEIHGRSVAKLNGREQDIRREFGSPAAVVIPGAAPAAAKKAEPLTPTANDHQSTARQLSKRIQPRRKIDDCRFRPDARRSAPALRTIARDRRFGPSRRGRADCEPDQEARRSLRANGRADRARSPAAGAGARHIGGRHRSGRKCAAGSI